MSPTLNRFIITRILEGVDENQWKRNTLLSCCHLTALALWFTHGLPLTSPGLSPTCQSPPCHPALPSCLCSFTPHLIHPQQDALIATHTTTWCGWGGLSLDSLGPRDGTSVKTAVLVRSAYWGDSVLVLMCGKGCLRSVRCTSEMGELSNM